MQEIDGYALLQLSQTDLGSNLMLKLGPARTVHSCIPHFCSSLALSRAACNAATLAPPMMARTLSHKNIHLLFVLALYPPPPTQGIGGVHEKQSFSVFCNLCTAPASAYSTGGLFREKQWMWK